MLLIIDGNNFGFRSFGQAPLTYEGKRVEMIFVGLSMLRKYLVDFKPSDCYIVWDGGHDKQRTEIYPEYKRRKKEYTKIEQREREIFFDQMNRFQRVLNSFEIPQIRCLGREADDIIASLIDKETKVSEFIIISTDKDFYQLWLPPLKKKVRIYSPGKKKEVTKEDVEKELGILIEYFIEYKAMIGDASDNLPGVKGLGPTAARWLVNNILSQETRNQKVERSDRRKVDLLFDNIETFHLMRKLIQFVPIDSKEINAGKSESKTIVLAGYEERVVWTLQKHGFNKFLEHFDSFFAPFVRLWRERNK